MAEDNEQINVAVRNLLNRHGFSFQYAVVERIVELSRQSKATWRFENTEIPVNQGSDQTHIDAVFEFIALEISENKRRNFVVAECKKVNRAMGNWCFFRSPVRTKSDSKYKHILQFDSITFDAINGTEGNAHLAHLETMTPYEIGLPFKTHEKGDCSDSSGKSAIDTSVAQVLRGLKGYIEYLVKRHLHRQNDNDERLAVVNVFVPVIFTTATLYSTDADISKWNLREGTLEIENLKAEKKPWIWYNHNRSFQLSHSFPLNYETHGSYYNRYLIDFTRSIAIVSQEGVDQFVKDGLSFLKRW